MEARSIQTTHVLTHSATLEWKIDNFDKLVRLLKNGQYVSSKPFGERDNKIVWELNIFPNGKRIEDQYVTSFFLRQIGTSSEETVTAEFNISVKNVEGEFETICKDTKDFLKKQGRGLYQIGKGLLFDSMSGDGSLFLKCEVLYFPHNDCVITVGSTYLSHFDKVEKLTEILSDIYEREICTDVIINVSGREIKAHRAILSARSRFFQNMFKSKSYNEANTGVVHIDDEPFDVIEELVHFLYVGRITKPMTDTLCEQLLFLADKYDVEILKKICEDFFILSVDAQSFAHFYTVSVFSSAGQLKQNLEKLFCDFFGEIIKSPGFADFRQTHPELYEGLLEIKFRKGDAKPEEPAHKKPFSPQV